MKKTLGAFVLTLLPLVIAAGCSSSRPPSKPTPPQQPEFGENWAKAGATGLPSRPANDAAARTGRLASR